MARQHVFEMRAGPISVSASWPLPALLAWAASWGVFAALRELHAPSVGAMAAAALLGAGLSLLGNTPWRRLFVALGFPLSLAASGVAGAIPAWGWLLPLLLLVLVYPLNAWRDAPLFPTPAGALAGLALAAPLPANARVLDAGCGLGAGLRELHREYPLAEVQGLEWSWPLRLLCALRCRFAQVRRGDIWAADWSGFELVYLFQRPESLPRAIEKAQRELPAGAWIVSLEFDAKGVEPTKMLKCADGRPLWLYQLPFFKR